MFPAYLPYGFIFWLGLTVLLPEQLIGMKAHFLPQQNYFLSFWMLEDHCLLSVVSSSHGKAMKTLILTILVIKSPLLCTA
jgi:hypothetical protein